MSTAHAGSAETPEMSDLDGYSIPGDYSYSMQSHYTTGHEDFGFDPPQSSGYLKSEPFSPPTVPDPLHLSGWSGFEGVESKDALTNQCLNPSQNLLKTFELDRMLNNTLPNPSTAVARYGQVTPPRSNSATSEEHNKSAEASSPKTVGSERRKRGGKASVKEESEPGQPTAVGKKRKNARRSSAAKEEQDDKRKQSLEKNRVAAAKCRINKKEKTEQLQRSSHEKAVHNAFLKEQVMRMKEEVQQMTAFLLAHANCEGCKSPEEIQKHLSNIANEFFSQHMSSMNYEYSQVDIDDMARLDPAMQADYFAAHTNSNMLNPPLPDFDRAAEFEVHTPMQTD